MNIPYVHVYTYIHIYSREYKYSVSVYVYIYTHIIYSFLSIFYRGAKRIIVMCLENSSTQIIIHNFAWKYYFINYKTLCRRNVFEDQVRKGDALFRIASVTEEQGASF